MINLAFLTGARSEYGIAKSLLFKLRDDDDINLMMFPNGMHLLKIFGYTLSEIKKDGFSITKSINTYDCSEKKFDQFSNSVKMISKVLEKYNIDAIYLIGDRIEAYSAALAGHFLKIPVIHSGGGTITRGAVDNIYRYNITNLSEIHLSTSKNNYNRLLQCPLTDSARVFFTGSTAIDAILDFKKNKMKIKVIDSNYYALMTFHPVTAKEERIDEIMDIAIREILKHKCEILITYPNNDTGYEKIIKVINKWENHEKIFTHKSLGTYNYYNAIERCLFGIGNSSSGVVEFPYFNKISMNIGSRQDGRDKDSSVIDIVARKKRIIEALDDGFKNSWDAQKCNNLYGNGDAIKKTIKIIKNL